MIKIQQKISGSWRTTTGADSFLALRAYISTTRKQGRDILDALARLAKHQPWPPATPDPEHSQHRPEQSRNAEALAAAFAAGE